MGRVFLVELEGRIYRCRFCQSHLALSEELISRSFHCRRGKAYLFNTVVNVWAGYEEDRMLLSGLHTVADIFCCCCGQNVGWKYVAAHEKGQKFKESLCWKGVELLTEWIWSSLLTLGAVAMLMMVSSSVDTYTAIFFCICKSRCACYIWLFTEEY